MLVYKGEAPRGCGLRKYRGLYLVSDPGQMLPCNVMPWPILPCNTCGLSPAEFSRGFQWIRPAYFSTQCNAKCPARDACAFTAPAKVTCTTCDGEGFNYPSLLDKVAAGLGMEEAEKVRCRSCRGRGQVENLVGLMWVGAQYYTPTEFIAEAKARGVSKRIPANQVPRGLRLSGTWVMLAQHNSLPCPDCAGEDCPACDGRGKVSSVFHAFQPQRLEMIVRESDLTDADGPTQLAVRLESQNITPVIAPDDQLVEEE